MYLCENNKKMEQTIFQIVGIFFAVFTAYQCFVFSFGLSSENKENYIYTRTPEIEWDNIQYAEKNRHNSN